MHTFNPVVWTLFFNVSILHCCLSRFILYCTDIVASITIRMKEIHLGLKQLKPIQFLPLSSGAQLSRCAGSLANLRGAYLAKATDGLGSVRLGDALHRKGGFHHQNGKRWGFDHEMFDLTSQNWEFNSQELCFDQQEDGNLANKTDWFGKKHVGQWPTEIGQVQHLFDMARCSLTAS